MYKYPNNYSINNFTLSNIYKKGRNSKNRIVCFSVGRFLKKTKFFKFQLNLKLLSHTFLIKKQKIKKNKYFFSLLSHGECFYIFSILLKKFMVGEFFFNSFYNYFTTLSGLSFGSYCKFLIFFSKKYAFAFKSKISYLLKIRKLYYFLLPSGFLKVVDSDIICLNYFHNIKNNKKKKASSMYFTGKKSRVRGIAKNPNDHPNGGRSNTHNPYHTPWGLVVRKKKKLNG